MTRTLTAGMQTEVAATRATLCYFVELVSSGGTLRFCTANQTITWNAQSWAGSGGVMEVGPVQESPGTQAPGIPLVLAGVDQTIISDLMTNHMRGRTVKVWLAHLSDAGAVVADPVGPFTGFLNDDWVIEEVSDEQGQATGRVTVKTTATSLVGLGEQTRVLICSVPGHNEMLARAGLSVGDTFFSTVPTIAGRWMNWGGGQGKLPEFTPPERDS